MNKNGVYFSAGRWTEQDNYVLCKLLDQGHSRQRIAQLMQGRTEGSITSQKHNLSKDDQLNANFWEARLKEKGVELPDLPTFQATLGVEKPEQQFVIFELDGLTQEIGKGSKITIPVGDLIVEVKVY